jgi:DNA-binding response OmpR family regulator
LLRRRRDEADPDAGAPPRVLVIGDDEGSTELESRILAAQGYDVRRGVLGGDDAAAEIASFRPHCTVLDLSDGGIGSNLKVLDGIRAHHDPSVANARVVFVAAHGHNRMFSWQAGVDGFVSRPFHGDELLTEVADAVTRSDEERAPHRRHQLDAARAQGRARDEKPWETRGL